jgi:hypothetical protein
VGVKQYRESQQPTKTRDKKSFLGDFHRPHKQIAAMTLESRASWPGSEPRERCKTAQREEPDLTQSKAATTDKSFGGKILSGKERPEQSRGLSAKSKHARLLTEQENQENEQRAEPKHRPGPTHAGSKTVGESKFYRRLNGS